MGGRASKTKPNNATATLSRRGTFQTMIITVDPTNECVDEVCSTVDGDQIRLSETDEPQGDSANKFSKVQEILEGKIELKRHQQTLEHLPAHVPPLDLQFSSSEDSEDETTKKKRKGNKKKTKKRRDSGSKVPASPTKAAPTPSPVKLKLNDLKLRKKSITQPIQNPKEHFEQIKDAYALAEYTAKDTNDPHNDPSVQPIHIQQSPIPPPPQQESPQSRHYSPFKSKQQPSPSSSPSKFFANAFDNWRKPTNSSSRSNRSQIMEHRDPSRGSPPKSNHSTPSNKSTSSRDDRDVLNSRRHSFKRDGADLDLEAFDLDTTDVLGSFSRPRSQTTASKITEGRPPSSTDPSTKRYQSEKRSLRIDDTDESIMADILAEVVT